jgi:hypothetical protein
VNTAPPSSRQAVALGLGFVAMFSLVAIPPVAAIAPAFAILILILSPASPSSPRRAVPATPSARLRAVALPSMSDSLLWIACGASIGLAYLVVILTW